MQKINSFLLHDWILEIETRFDMEPDERQALPLYEIIRNFKSSIESNQQELNEKEKVELAKKVKILSEEKMDYYHSSRFGFIKQIFSALRNGWLMGRWQSSGQLGLELSQQVINQAVLKQPSEEDDQAIPTWIKKKLQREKKKQEITEKRSKPTQITEKVQLSDPIPDLKKPVQSHPVSESIQADDCKEVTNQEQNLSTIDQITQEEQIGRLDLDSKSDHALPKEEEIEPPIIIIKEIQPAQPSKIKTIKTALEEMIETFQTVWKNASLEERKFIQRIWEIMISSTELVSWKPTGKINEYQIELKNEVFGSHPQIPIGYLVLKQSMKIAFFEKYDLESGLYSHIVTFPDAGVCYRVGWGLLSKDTAIKSITIKEYDSNNIWCSLEALGQQVEASSLEILNFWKQVQWS